MSPRSAAAAMLSATRSFHLSSPPTTAFLLPRVFASPVLAPALLVSIQLKSSSSHFETTDRDSLQLASKATCPQAFSVCARSPLAELR